MTTMTLDQIAARYIDLRNKKKDLEDSIKPKLQLLNEAMELLENSALDYLNKQGTSSARTSGGTIVKMEHRTYKIADSEAFFSAVESLGRADFLEKRVAKKVVDEYLEDGGTLPPGLAVESRLSVQFRKA